MLTQAEFDAMLQRYLDGHSRPGEARVVEEWSAQLGHNGQPPLPPALREEVRTAMWQRIEAATAGPMVPVVRRLLPTAAPAWWRQPALRWAAAAALTVGTGTLGWWLASHYPVAHAAPTAARLVQHTNTSTHAELLRLADGSQITLGPNSSVTYTRTFAGPRREVSLRGRAFFKVAKNPAQPFLVYTESLITTVLGTSFLVTAYPHQPNSVAVCEGRVAVQRRQGAQLTATPAHPGAKGLLLLPNQQTTCSATTRELAKNLVPEPALLAAEPLDFHNRPVVEVLAALEHAYGVTILHDPVKLRGCTLTISLGEEPLFEQLDTICQALDASYKLVDNAQIVFQSRGCKAS